MPYDDPRFMAAKWGRLLGAGEVPDLGDLSVEANRRAFEEWALDELRNGPPEARQVHEQMMGDDDVRAAFFETLWEPV